MKDLTKILAAFKKTVGFRNENQIVLATGLNDSLSGLYVNSIPGISLQNINSQIFIKNNQQPEMTVSQYLDKIYEDAVIELINNFVNRSNVVLKSKEFFESGKNVSENLTTKKANTDKFVGYLLNIANSKTLNLAIKSVFIQISKPQEVYLYLYEVNRREPINVFIIDVEQSFNRTYNNISDCILQYENSNGTNLTYLLGIYQADMDTDTEFYTTKFNKQNKFSKLNIAAVEIPQIAHNYNNNDDLYDLPEVSEIKFINDCFFGFEYEINADYTDLIINNKLLFAETLQYMIAKRIVGDCLYTNNNNVITEINRQNWSNLLTFIDMKIMGYTTDGGNNKVLGLLDGIVKNFENIDNELFRNRYKFNF
jgi:hypothetical protein